MKKTKNTIQKNILCFGDSNTWGCEPFEHVAAMPRRMEHRKRWTQIMARKSSLNLYVVEDGLSARTTVFDDPIEGDHKNGSRLLVASIETHAPLDLVIIMLGTNDFKMHFNATSFTSARGVLTLIQQVKGYYVLSNEAPEILIVAPPALSKNAEPAFWSNAWERFQGYPEYIAQVADRSGCFSFNSNKVASVGEDGIHLTEAGHESLGTELAKQVDQILKMK